MGCDHSRDHNNHDDKNEQDKALGIKLDRNEIEIINDKEDIMKIYEYTVDDISIAFFGITIDDIITYKQIQKCFDVLSVKLVAINDDKDKMKNLDGFCGNIRGDCSTRHSSKDDGNKTYYATHIYNRFLNTFGYDNETYDATSILIALYLMTKSPLEHKASALYNLYDVNLENKLNEVEISLLIQRICECVFEYSISLSKIDPELKITYSERIRERIEKVTNDMIEHLYMSSSDNDNGSNKKTIEDICFDQKMFIDLLKNIKYIKGLDLTSTKSIRKNLMGFLVNKHELSRSSSKKKVKWANQFDNMQELSTFETNNSHLSTRNPSQIQSIK